MATSVDLVNRALEQIGAQTTIFGFPPDDNSPAAQAAAVLYAPAVDMVLREGSWDFARKTAILTLLKTANVPPVDTWDATQPVPPWRFEYLYPDDCLYLRYLRPNPVGFRGGDGYEPVPVTYTLASDILDVLPPGLTNPVKVILTDLESALGIYTIQPPESAWDAIFQEAVVRTLASSFAMSLAGRPDFSKAKLEESFQVIGVGEQRVG